MQSTMLSAGDPIEARCTKCRKNTDQVIVTMTEEHPDKVRCGACGREHKYRPPTAAKRPSTRKAVDHKDDERKEWKLLRPGMKVEKAADYSMTDPYKVKMLINHPIFGLGLVQRVVGSKKVEVLFEDGKKTMCCK